MNEIKLTIECPEVAEQLKRIADALEGKKTTATKKTGKKAEPAEAPKTEAPKAEAPKAEAPKEEAPTPAAVTEDLPPEAVEAETPPFEPDPKKYTGDDLKSLGREVVKKSLMKELQDLMKEFGVSRVSAAEKELDPKQMQAFGLRLEALNKKR